MDNYEGAPRYSLIVENDINKYYYDINLKRFVQLEDNEKETKTTLRILDYLTSSFNNKEFLSKAYGIDNIKRCYITYQFKGEKLLAPIFDNKEWNGLLERYKGKEIDFTNKENALMFYNVYSEIVNPDSNFSNILLSNPKRLINLSPKTIETIKAIKVHERAIKEKKKYSDYTDNIKKIYEDDRYGFYCDLRKRFKKYREFRTIYLNYCKYKNIEKENIEEKSINYKKVLIPPHQISMFE